MRLSDEAFNLTACTRTNDINEILEQYDGFINALARKNIPRTIILTEVIDLEIDELIQITRLKLWIALQKQDIRNMKGYIRRIVYNEVVNMVRRHKPFVPLNTNDEGELSQAYVMVGAVQEIQDPAENIEEEEMLCSYSGKLTEDVLKLPPQQQRAMICALKDQVADLLPLADMFLPFGIDVESVHWPEAEDAVRSTRVSLSIARRKLRASKTPLEKRAQRNDALLKRKK